MLLFAVQIWFHDSVEEAKKKIYALSTTTYQGFQVLCSEEESEKFKGKLSLANMSVNFVQYPILTVFGH